MVKRDVLVNTQCTGLFNNVSNQLVNLSGLQDTQICIILMYFYKLMAANVQSKDLSFKVVVH